MFAPSISPGSLSTLCLVFATGCGIAERTAADRFTETGELIALSGGDAGAANACFTCHGRDGQGNGADTPRLAAIDAGYLAAQLEAYASGRRKNARMENIARKLTLDELRMVAAYYASLPAPVRVGTSSDGRGRKLYHEGDSRRGIPACVTCHGADGSGVGSANPPLSGQPAAYLAEQIAAWQRSDRRNDPENLMLDISRRLSPEEAEAVSAYAAALPLGPPRPESRGASPEGHRGDPRNDVSAPLLRAAAPGR